MDVNSYNKVSSVVDHFTLKKGLSTAHWFPWALTMGLWHLRELRLDTWQEPITLELPVTDRNTVVLPVNYVDWVKIGVRVGQYVVTLAANDELNTLNRTANDGNIVHGLLSQNLPNGLGFGNYSGLTFYNFNGGSFNGIGLGLPSKGTFKVVDHGSSKEILLDYDYPYTSVYLEHITDGFDPCGETVLSPYLCDFFLKAMESAYEDEKNPAATEASKDRKARELRDAIRVVRARRNDITPKTLLTMSRAEVRFTPHI